MIATPIAAILGVAGVGKSALAAACAARSLRPIIEVHIEEGASLTAWFGELRRDLIRRASARQPEAAALVLIDDVQRVELDRRAQFLAELARCLGRSRAILTSRERLPVAHGYDRFEVRLRGVGPRAARRMWHLLDASYGRRGGFQTALRASAGNPAMLRRAHAGTVTGDHPLLATLSRLPPDQLAILSALALARIPVPVAALVSLLDGDRGAIALAALQRALLVELDGAGVCAPDPLARELLLQLIRADSDAAADLHRLLPGVLAHTDLDPVTLARETTHHLGCAGEWDEAAAYLAARAHSLVEQGASSELLACLSELPPGSQTPALAVWRARCRLRLLDLREGEAEIERALTHPEAHRRELLLLLARILLLRGSLDEAQATLASAAVEPSGSTRDQASLAMIGAIARSYRDEVDEALADLAEAVERLPDHAHKLRATAAALRWLDFYGAGAFDIGAASSPERHDRAVGLRGAALLPIATSGLAGAADALVLETDSALRLSEARLRRHRDLLSRVHVGAVRAMRMWDRGERLESLAQIELAARLARRHEYRAAALWLEIWAARSLFYLGRRAAAEALLATSVAEAERMGARWIVRAAARARAQEPVARFLVLARRDGPAPWMPSATRARAYALLAAAASHDESRAGSLRHALSGAIDGPAFGVERALVALAGGTLSLLRGDAGGYAEASERARELLRDDGADSDLIDRLLVVLGDVVVTASGRRMAPERSWFPPRGEIVLDRDSGELRTPSVTIPFARRHVLRRLLYRMALCPGEVVTKDVLAHAAWGVGYHPLRHANALFVNIHRLRALLDGTGLGLTSSEDGYALSAPPGFRFLDGARDSVLASEAPA
ncbi:MAG TPA: helix-turn-helix domain-containing protein [Kofleriaceae bacterium]|nr:helix-turn-helix domain-containing protein [Kofleriaceae bacterium]